MVQRVSTDGTELADRRQLLCRERRWGVRRRIVLALRRGRIVRAMALPMTLIRHHRRHRWRGNLLNAMHRGDRNKGRQRFVWADQHRTGRRGRTQPHESHHSYHHNRLSDTVEPASMARTNLMDSSPVALNARGESGRISLRERALLYAKTGVSSYRHARSPAGRHPQLAVGTTAPATRA